jgi:hypothetical protein
MAKTVKIDRTSNGQQSMTTVQVEGGYIWVKGPTHETPVADRTSVSSGPHIDYGTGKSTYGPWHTDASGVPCRPLWWD